MVSTFPSLPSLNLCQIRLEIRNLQAQLVRWRRKIHQHPELGFQEQLTAQFIAEKLDSWGIQHQAGIAQTGVVATLEGNKPGPVLALRADMDALPIQEENEVPYRSQCDGVMHACGHDGHTAIALGTAYYLAQHCNDFQGTVKIVFQPAEEGPGGAKPMVEAGVLSNPAVEAVVSLHLLNNLPIGTIGVRQGAILAADETFDCTIFGKGGHGAMPDQTIDSIVVVSQIITTLQSIVARNLDPLDTVAISVGKLEAGTAINAIADAAYFGGTVRYFNPDLGKLIRQRLEEIIAGVCQAHGATYTLNYSQNYPPVINDPTISSFVNSIALNVVESPEKVISDCQLMAADDVAFFLQTVPGCHFFIGSANSEKNLVYPHHHPRFDFDEAALSLGVEMFVRCVEKFGERSRRN